MSGNKFSQVPEWVIDADISDTAFRLYAVLLRYANAKTGKAYPARSTLAKRLRKGTSAIDRALKDLTKIGAVKVVPRYQEGSSERRSNEYIVTTKQPNNLASKTKPGSPKNEATVASKTKSGVASKTKQRTIPTMNDTHTNDSANNAGTETPPNDTTQGELIPHQKPVPKKSNITPQQLATQDAYERTGKSFNFKAVLSMARWLINDRGLTPEQTADAIVDVYQQGKYITKVNLGQHIDGHTTMSPGTQRAMNTMQLAQQMQNAYEQQFKETS